MESKRIKGAHWEAEINVDLTGTITWVSPMLRWAKGQTVEDTVKKIEEKGWPGPIKVEKAR